MRFGKVDIGSCILNFLAKDFDRMRLMKDDWKTDHGDHTKRTAGTRTPKVVAIAAQIGCVLATMSIT